MRNHYQTPLDEYSTHVLHIHPLQPYTLPSTFTSQFPFIHFPPTILTLTTDQLFLTRHQNNSQTSNSRTFNLQTSRHKLPTHKLPKHKLQLINFQLTNVYDTSNAQSLKVHTPTHKLTKVQSYTVTNIPTHNLLTRKLPTHKHSKFHIYKVT